MNEASESVPVKRVSLALALLCAGAALSGLAAAIPAAAQELRVAAAADLQFALDELRADYQKQSGKRADISYGSSGNFFAQLQSGAPFDLFLSANIDYPRRLEAAGLAEPGTLYEYAVGRIALYLPGDSRVNLEKLEWNALLDPSIQKIAIANPEHAPYGRAAIESLHAVGMYEHVRGKLVYGENIAQAAQFVASGSAQAGILALSLAVSPPLKNGLRWEIPVNLHAPIIQSAIILRAAKNKDAAQAFLALLKSDAGRKILQSYGFGAPPAQPSSSSVR